MFKNLFDRKFGITVVVLAIFNLLLVTFVYSIGVSTGFAGEFSWSAKSFTDAIGSLFGSITSLMILIGTIALIGFGLWITHWLSKKQKRVWLIIWAITIFVLGLILSPAFHITDFSFGFGPVLVLIVFTAIEALVTKLVVNRPLANRK